MKKIAFIFALVSVLFLSSCERQNNHQAQWSSDGKDSVVYVEYINSNGSLTSFYMNYMLFNSLFRQGGYGACYSYYNNYPERFVNTSSKYSNYRYDYSNRLKKSYSSPSQSFNNNSSGYYKKSYSSPNQSSAAKSSYSSPSSYSSSSSSSYKKSYSSPSSSSSSYKSSYSSPSRSSSSYRSSSSPSRRR